MDESTDPVSGLPWLGADAPALQALAADGRRVLFAEIALDRFVGLVDGLPRLRDTLAQLGMNVAGVDSRSGFSGQNDGKSTKQQNREVWYSARRGSVVGSTSPVDGGDQRRSSKLDIWA